MDPDNTSLDTSIEDNASDKQHLDQGNAGQEQPYQPEVITKIADIQRMNIDQLNQFGKKIGLKHLGSLTKSQMVFEIVKSLAENPREILYGEGVLEILPDGFGFLRSPNYNYLPSPEDIYIPPAQIRRFDLKKGDTLCGT